MDSSLDTKKKIGDILIKEGLIEPLQLSQALELQKKQGGRVGEILIAAGLVRRIDFYAALSKHLDLPFLDLTKEKVDPHVIQLLPLDFMKENRVVPIRIDEGKLLVAMSDPLNENVEDEIKKITGFSLKKGITTEYDILWVLTKCFENELKERSIELLYKQKPEVSAKRSFTNLQIFGFIAAVGSLICVSFFSPIFTFTLVNGVIQILFFLSVLFKLSLTLLGARVQTKRRDEEQPGISDEELPTYTVLIPVYKEVEVLPHLIDSIRKIDYPKSKLDVKILLEEDDVETLLAAKKLKPEGFFEFVVVPTSFPKTKPKACNWGLQFARGKYVTIFDAEDEPEPDQLKKVVLAFKKAPPNTMCIQARLNYYNPNENFLTRMFTLEYSYWFDYLLPGLESMPAPIPLGGTSNHFVTERLIELGGWDPFNVTEDADLGVRATRLGYRVQTVDSTTFEEANARVRSWIKQRSRWIKGYMQTYAVHMRHPIKLFRELGIRGFIGFQLFIGGTPFTFLVSPILWGIFLLWLFAETNIIDPIFPPWILYISIINLLVGNGMLIFMNIIAVWRRELYNLTPWALLNPVYWILHSIAAWKAQWQIIRKPFYWEKTPHGISKNFMERKAYLDGKA